MEKDPSPDIAFSLVDVLLPMAEMWKILLVVPAFVAGMVYLALQFYPAELTYSATVHLPEQQVRTLVNEEALTGVLATVATDISALPSADDLMTRLQITFNKEDQTALSITLPRRAASPELLRAITELLRPAAERFLDAQKNQVADDIALSQRTLASLRAAAAASNAALESMQASAEGTGATGEMTQSLIDITNSLAGSQSWLYAYQARANELAMVNAVEPFRPVSRTPLLVALSGGGGMLFLVLAYIYIRQEIRFALSHENGRQKVARMMQHLKIFSTGKAPRP